MFIMFMVSENYIDCNRAMLSMLFFACHIVTVQVTVSKHQLFFNNSCSPVNSLEFE